MIIKLNPICQNVPATPPAISLSGLVLTVGDTIIDLSLIEEGCSDEWDDPEVVKGTVTRDRIEVVYPYSTQDYEPNQPSDPSVYEIELMDGQTLQCPLIKRPSAPEAAEEPTKE